MASGVIAASTQSAQDMYNELESMLTAHAAWEFVETHNNGTNDFHIWRNLGAANSWGADFYVAVTVYNAVTLRFFAFEQWDATNKLVINPCGPPNQTSVTTNADAALDAATNGVALNATASNYFNIYTDLVGNEVDFNWWMWVDSDTIRGMTSNDNYLLHIGIFDPFWPNHPSEFPLVQAHLNHPYSYFTAGSCSRIPGFESRTYSAYRQYPFAMKMVGNNYYGVSEGTVPTDTRPLYGGGVLGAPILVSHDAPTMGNGAYRGLYKKVMYFSPHTDVQKGDTITMDAITYVYTGQYGLWVVDG